MKIKNVFSKGRMNKDFDERLIPEGEYSDALNVRIVNTANGDAGSVQNVTGNTVLSNIGVSGNPRVIGAVPDESTERIYWFVVNASGHGYIFEYDVTSNIQRLILKDTRGASTNVLKFDAQYKVYGNVIYNITKKENILLFTDGKNSPKLVNIERASSYGENNFQEDDISLYKKPPYQAPSVRPFFSLNREENQIKENFFAFAYRYKYLDGQYSALSSFTNYQFSPATFSLDWGTMENKGMIGLYNGYNIEYNTGDKRVTDIDICFKFSKDNTVYVIDTINKEESQFSDDMTKSYQFINKKIFKALPSDELFRIFDDVPLTAKTQDFIKNRIIFGNTTSQYNLEKTESTATEDYPVLSIDYDVELSSTSFAATILTTTVGSGALTKQITIDFTDIVFDVDSEFLINIDLISPEEVQTIGSNNTTYGNGVAGFTAGIVLSATYNNLSSFLASTDWTTFVSTMNANFASVATITNPSNVTATEYGDFTVVSNTATAAVLQAPLITFTIDDTPSNSSDSNFSTITSQFTWQAAVEARWTELNSSLSLKSNRSFEFGLVYLDSFGRYSSVLLPKESETTGASEIFIPVGNSTNQNRAKITINHTAPYWADRYKFFVKTNKELYYNIFATIFYEDGVYRWVSLEGNNIGKVEKGSMMIVKSDDEGPLNSEVKVKVLDIATKSAQDERTAGEGWVEDNEDAAGEPIIERPGIYMKIKPKGFKMDFNPNNYINYRDSSFENAGIGAGVNGRTIALELPGRNPAPFIVPSVKELGFLQVLNAGGTAYDDLVLRPGTIIELDFDFDGYNSDPSFTFKKKFTVRNTYTTTSTQNAFDLWADAETTWAKSTINIYGQNRNKFHVPSQDEENEGFEFYLWKDTTGIAPHSNSPPWTTRWIMHITSTEHTAWAQRGRLTIDINMVLLNGVLIFETDPKELNSEVYYETEETFKITTSNGDRYHQGNTQHQTNSQPAIVNLGFGNCFSFGNGVESISIRDDRFEPFLDVDSRPNINLLEGYRRLENKNKLIYSSSFNENSNYNSLNEFNSSRGITKFMDMKYGSIQKVYSREDDLIVFQEDRVSKVLYGKGVLSTPDGTGSLTQIEQVLGNDVPFTGEFGIGKSPESFASYENSLYFADPFRGAVLRLGQNGITPISSEGMKSYFKVNLYGNRNYFNPGGYDPKHNQYILTPGESIKSTVIPQTTCNSEFVANVSKTSSYEYIFTGINIVGGAYKVNYAVTGGNADITITYNSVQTTTTVSGSGALTITGHANDTTANIRIVTNSGASSDTSAVTIENECPAAETMSVTILVVNDAYKANDNIINRFKHSAANVYNSNTDVFDSSGTTRYETYTGDMGSNNIPSNGSTVTVSSLRLIGTHSGDFNPCNDFGYWVTSAVSPTVADILTNANFSGSITQAETAAQEENSLQFTFNRSNTNENLYLVFDYRDTLPVLVDDAVTAISNGGSSTINVVANDTVPSPYTLTIETAPTNGTAVVVSGSSTSITYSHTSGQALSDSFQYRISRGGTCAAVANVSTQALAITENTYIYIYFDNSGSMANTITELQAMRTNSLKGVLQDLYATAGTESSGNNNAATNGSNAYDSHVTIYGNFNTFSTTWSNERTYAALSDPDINDFLANGHNDFPADADNVIVMIFQDEANPIYHATGTEPTSTCQTDIATLRSRMTTLNASNSNFYRGVVFQVDGSVTFKSHINNVFSGASPYASTAGLSDFNQATSGVLKPYLTLVNDIEDSNNNDATAPHKPAPNQSERFDKWEYYYLYWVTKALDDLGFDDNGSLGWPIIKDDG